MAEARQAEVSLSIYNLFVFVLGTLLLVSCFYTSVLFSVGVIEEAACGAVGARSSPATEAPAPSPAVEAPNPSGSATAPVDPEV